jgi:hypothetical protein
MEKLEKFVLQVPVDEYHFDAKPPVETHFAKNFYINSYAKIVLPTCLHDCTQTWSTKFFPVHSSTFSTGQKNSTV